MANVCIILGPSGMGKSSSIKGLNPKETVIINTLGKRLPFKGSSSVYNTENKNFFKLETYTSVISLLESINTSTSNIKNIVIDDAIYIMRKEFFKRASENGFAKFTQLAQHFQSIISTCENMRDDINVFLMLHAEDVVSDGIVTTQKVSTVGKLLSEQYNPVEAVSIVLNSAIQYDDKGKPTYGFYTHRFKQGTYEIFAKSPEEMFAEDFMPNDLGLVVKAMQEYYG